METTYTFLKNKIKEDFPDGRKHYRYLQPQPPPLPPPNHQADPRAVQMEMDIDLYGGLPHSAQISTSTATGVFSSSHRAGSITVPLPPPSHSLSHSLSAPTFPPPTGPPPTGPPLTSATVNPSAEPSQQNSFTAQLVEAVKQKTSAEKEVQRAQIQVRRAMASVLSLFLLLLL
jgi:hypothetical protein